MHSTITRILEILNMMNPNAPINELEQFQKLINVDTLKAMQLLGFNYKAAIGEPLTELCASTILSLKKSQNKDLIIRLP